jgi:hypothetical protein
MGCNCDTGKALRAVTIEYRARDISLDKGERTKKQPLLKERKQRAYRFVLRSRVAAAVAGAFVYSWRPPRTRRHSNGVSSTAEDL